MSSVTAEDGSFPTLRAWFVLSNHSHRLATGLFLCFPAAIGLLPLAMVLSMWIPWINAESTSGRITGKQIATTDGRPGQILAGILAHGGGKNRKRYTVTYSFIDAQGRGWIGTGSVPAEDWTELQPGDSIEVWYLPDNPAKSRPWSGVGSAELAPAVFGFFGIIAVATAIFLVVTGVTEVGRQVKLLRDGELAIATITSFELLGATKRNKPYAATLTYEFEAREHWTAPSSRVSATCTTRENLTTPERMRGEWPVVYDPDNPERSLLDIFRLRSRVTTS